MHVLKQTGVDRDRYIINQLCWCQNVSDKLQHANYTFVPIHEAFSFPHHSRVYVMLLQYCCISCVTNLCRRQFNSKQFLLKKIYDNFVNFSV